jgi:serine/threonine protein kinase
MTTAAMSSMSTATQSIEIELEESLVEDRPLEEHTVLITPGEQARPVEPPPATERFIGTTIGHYEVKELIGRGNFGEVYRAVDPRLGRDVAIKVAARSVADDPGLRKICWNEARVQARLEHSNIVPIYDLLEESGHLVMVMRLIHGEDLDKRLAKMVRPFTTHETLHLMRQVSSAVGMAHEKGVIHQDLKPGNIRLTPDSEAVVLDFGVARIAGAGPDHIGATGTPAYMSPEQINGDAVDARADIYSLAMTLYKTLTGHHPFEGARNLTELLAWQCMRAPPAPTKFNPNLPGPLAEVILQGLQKDPRERFRACGDFARAVGVAVGVEEAEAEDHDGRWDPRAQVNLPAQVRLPGDDELEARVVDLSTSGAALRMRQPLRVGTYAGLAMHIPLRNAKHVVRCSLQSVGSFDRAVLVDLVRAVLVRGKSAPTP